MSKPKRRRAYDASGRQRRALENQERVLDAARRLFAERGYAETTLEAVASEAGVSLPTLYATFQSKRGVLSGVMHRLVSGQPGSPPLLQTAGPRAVGSEPDPRRALHLLVIDLTGVQERVIPIYEVMKNAARTEPEIAQQLAGMQEYRFKNLETFAVRLAELKALRPGLTVEDASRTLWAIASPEVRRMLLAVEGWTPERYRAWLEQTLAAALLRPLGERS